MAEENAHPLPAWAKTRVSARLAIEYPIVQGPFGGFASQKLTAAVSNFGGLGSFGAHGLPPSAIQEILSEIRSLTSKPFAMNLWISMEDEGAFTSAARDFEAALAPIAGYLQELGVPRPSFQPYQPIRFEDQARVLLDSNVPVFSFIAGIPPKEILDECRRKGIITLGTATTPDESIALEQAGVDLILASGFESGGHRVSFLRSAEDSLTGSFSLIPQVADSVSVPVIAGGGIADARGIAAAFALGAEGVLMGTVFLACEGSGASEMHRDAILKGKAARTALTRGFTGRLARGIHNHLLEELNQPDTAILPYPLQRGLMQNLTIAAQKAGREDLLGLWAGQSASLSNNSDAHTVLHRLVEDVSAKLR